MRGDGQLYALPGVCRGHLEAWRLWYGSDAGTLWSFAILHRWPEGDPTVGDVHHQDGHYLHPAGVYALPDRERLDDDYIRHCLLPERGHHLSHYCPRRDCYSTVGELHLVWGRVALWGEVIEHERGYRAQYAYPLSLSDERAAGKYACEVETWRSESYTRRMARARR